MVVTGLHLSDELGNTIEEIRSDGFSIDGIIDACPEDDSGTALAHAFSKEVAELTSIASSLQPDIILVLTDLGYALAGAIVGLYLNIPVAHLHGGDVSGAIDDSIRHAITKLSHLHFPATETSANRIRKLGEEEWRIMVSGAPGLDQIREAKWDADAVLARLNVPEPYAVLVQHPVTTEADAATEQIRKTLQALSDTALTVVSIYPNLDTGGQQIISELHRHPELILHRNLPREDYLALLSRATFMIGNSSSGIIEAASFQLPVVNIGSRERGREKANNVIDVDHDVEAIRRAIAHATSSQFRASLKHLKNPYGDGKAGERIANRLSEVTIDRKLLQKRLTY